MKFKILLLTVILFLILVIGVVLSLFFSHKTNNNSQAIPTPIVSTITPTNLPTIDTSPSITPLKMGEISGKLCYPSDFVPKGFVQAMNLANKEITQVEFKGSNIEKSTNFSIKLIPGKYYLRFEAHASLKDPKLFTYGYSTDICPTGLETTCSNTNIRKNIEYTVEADVNTEDVHICDFYYLPNTEPKF